MIRREGGGELAGTEAPAPRIVRRAVHLGGRGISYLAAESAEASDQTILLIHGSGVSARSWIGQLDGLGRALRVLAIDLPGHGESVPVGRASIEGYADVVSEFLGHATTGPVILAGHSLGGAVAVALAARRPGAVRGLILVSSCAMLPPSDGVAGTLISYLPGPLRKIAFFAMAKKVLFAPGAPTQAIRVGMGELHACRQETILGDLAAARAMDVTDAARRLEVPTLILCGSRDRLTPPALSAQLNALIRESRLRVIEGAGHMVLLEAPDRVNQEILGFAASLVPTISGRLPGLRDARRVPSLLRRLLLDGQALFRRARGLLR